MKNYLVITIIFLLVVMGLFTAANMELYKKINLSGCNECLNCIEFWAQKSNLPYECYDDEN